MNKEELLYSAEEHGRRYEMLEEIQKIRLENDQKKVSQNLDDIYNEAYRKVMKV